MRALGETGSERAVPALVKALAHDGETVRTAAASASGRVGGAADIVVALRQAEETFSGDHAFLRAVREAIASIQSRLVGADHGQLSVAPDSGELSLADDEPGA